MSEIGDIMKKHTNILIESANRWMNEASNFPALKLLQQFSDFDNEYGRKSFKQWLIDMQGNVKPSFDMDKFNSWMSLYNAEKLDTLIDELDDWYNEESGFGTLVDNLKDGIRDAQDQLEYDKKQKQDTSVKGVSDISEPGASKRRVRVSKDSSVNPMNKPSDSDAKTPSEDKELLKSMASKMAKSAYDKGILTDDDIKGKQGWRVDNNGNISVSSLSSVIKALNDKGIDAMTMEKMK